MSIVDDGGHADETGAKPTALRAGGHGLVGMRERVSVVGGTFEAGPRLDGGWSVQATIRLGAARPPNGLVRDPGRPVAAPSTDASHPADLGLVVASKSRYAGQDTQHKSNIDERPTSRPSR
jgi:hypothetical protein